VTKHLTPMVFGDRDTRERWLAECGDAKAAAYGTGAVFIVAPRHSVPTDRGLLGPGTKVSESDFTGFTRPYPSDDGTTLEIPLTTSQAFQRAIDFMIVLEC
jgi:hypothetical protein